MKKQIMLDSLIWCVALAGCFLIPEKIEKPYPALIGTIALIGILVLCTVDMVRIGILMQRKGKRQKQKNRIFQVVTELALLSEADERTIMRWELEGRTSLLIGKTNRDQAADIDLTETEYSALIDDIHCVLNYVGGSWYVEDLYSQNGIRIRKREDGICYKIAGNRPCRLSKGDVLLVANTKLLFR